MTATQIHKSILIIIYILFQHHLTTYHQIFPQKHHQFSKVDFDDFDISIAKIMM